MIVAFDLDGTLANNAKREYLARQASEASKRGDDSGPYWDAFHQQIMLDTPYTPLVKTAAALNDAGHIIELWTARPERFRDLTCLWLRDHGVPHCELVMRSDHDWRKAYIIKLEWYLTRERKPHLVFEDHPETTRLLRAAGCIVAQVGEGHV